MAERALILSGGYSHPYHESSPALAELVAEAGFEPLIEDDIDAALTSLAERPALLVVNTLRWSMTQHEKYGPDREAYAYELPDEYMVAIADYVAEGGALFVLHISTISFDTQPRWHEVMGGGWKWGHTSHPPLGKIHVRLTLDGASISDGSTHFELVDEAYHNLDPKPDCTILATCEIKEGPQPVAWVRRYGEGRVAVDSLGHDARSINAPGHRELIAAQLNWLKGGQEYA